MSYVENKYNMYKDCKWKKIKNELRDIAKYAMTAHMGLLGSK